MSLPDLPLGVVMPLLSATFGAGGAWFVMKQLRKEINGVGSKTGKIVLYLSETAEGEARKRLTDILKG